MNLCVIGNSHVASLKLGWDKIRLFHPNTVLTFFAQRSAGILGMVVSGKQLVAETEELQKAVVFTSGGKSCIDPGGYDGFLVYGLRAEPIFFQDYMKYSEAVRTSALNSRIKTTPSFTMIERLRQVTEVPIYVGHVPLSAIKSKQPTGSTDNYIKGLQLANQIVYSSVGAELVGQPLTTIGRYRNTLQIFTNNSRVLAIGDSWDNSPHPDVDSDHMNSDFGKLWLEEFFQRLRPI